MKMAKHLADMLIVAGVALVAGGVYLIWGIGITMLVSGIILGGYGAALDVRSPRRGPR